jgi:ribosomal protein S25
LLQSLRVSLKLPPIPPVDSTPEHEAPRATPSDTVRTETQRSETQRSETSRTSTSGDDTGRLLRPYAITGGRTEAPKSLHLESLVRRTERADGVSAQRWEAARIVAMADRPIAVVEIAARIGLPIGVAKVVIADLIAEGVLTTGPLPTETSFSSVLEKVLDGLDRI